jgi:hypothetical protein
LIKPAVSGNIEPATQFMHAYRKRNTGPITRAAIPVVNITKLMSTLYTDKLKQSKGGAATSPTQPGANLSNQPLHLMIFEMFLHRFGLRKVAETKLNVILDAAKFYSNRSRRLRLFARFLGIIEPPLDNDDFALYIECHRLFDDSFNGIQYTSMQTEFVLISTQKAIEILATKFASRLGPNETTAIIQDLENSKKQGNLGSPAHSDIGVDVDLDLILEQIIKINSSRRTEVKNHVKKVFQAADVDLTSCLVTSCNSWIEMN